MGRPPLLVKNPKLTAEVARYLAAGVTVEHTCAKLGFSTSAYYRWKERGQVELDRARAARKYTEIREREQPFVEFVEAVTRAEADAFANAAIALREGMLPHDVVTEVTETVTETRLDKDNQPYQYTKTTTRREVRHNPGDWRAAEAFLKRRDPKNWSERSEVTGADGAPLMPGQVNFYIPDNGRGDSD